MFARPPYAPLLVGVWLVPLLISIIVWPIPTPWALLAPRPYAETLGLQSARTVQTAPTCYAQGRVNWQAIAATPTSWTWFEALVREGHTPAARLYGLAGVAVTAPGHLRELISGLSSAELDESVAIVYADTTKYLWLDSITPLRHWTDSSTLHRLAGELAWPRKDPC